MSKFAPNMYFGLKYMYEKSFYSIMKINFYLAKKIHELVNYLYINDFNNVDNTRVNSSTFKKLVRYLKTGFDVLGSNFKNKNSII